MQGEQETKIYCCDRGNDNNAALIAALAGRRDNDGLLAAALAGKKDVDLDGLPYMMMNGMNGNN